MQIAKSPKIDPEHSYPMSDQTPCENRQPLDGTGPSSQKSNPFYQPELDFVRFLAFFLVFLTHSLPSGQHADSAALPGGLLENGLYGIQRVSVFGLNLFFTLSAFLISGRLLIEREATGTIAAKQFYIRRILRIWPLYFAGLSIGIAIAFALGGRQITFEWTAWAIVLLGNWFVVLRGFPGNVMFPLWSISVEEQFYLFAPWAVKLLSRNALAIFAIAMIVLANLQLFFLGSAHAPDRCIWYNSFVQFENLAFGILLYLLFRSWPAKIRPFWRVSLLAATALCWFVASYGLRIHTGSEEAPGSWALIGGYGLVALGCCFLLSAFLGLNNALLPKWTIYLGRISYGLYVFHMLAIQAMNRLFSHFQMFSDAAVLFKGAASLGLTVLIAAISYRYFEMPFLRLKKRHEIIMSEPA